VISETRSVGHWTDIVTPASIRAPHLPYTTMMTIRHQVLTMRGLRHTLTGTARFSGVSA